jgi:hypothetical protein
VIAEERQMKQELKTLFDLASAVAVSVVVPWMGALLGSLALRRKGGDHMVVAFDFPHSMAVNADARGPYCSRASNVLSVLAETVVASVLKKHSSFGGFVAEETMMGIHLCTQELRQERC